MTLAAGSRRKHALAYVRRMIASGDFTKADVARWTEELGDDVAGIVQELAPTKPTKPADGPKE